LTPTVEAVAAERVADVAANDASVTIDAQALRAEVGDDDIFLQLCQLFLQDAGSLALELAEALAAGDMERLYRAAHRIKGSVSVFHAPRAVARFGKLESAARAGDMGIIEMEYQASRRVLDSLVNQIEVAQGAKAA
jgi:HPt (histidine-containing phosphotransfer) domain-containing protein